MAISKVERNEALVRLEKEFGSATGIYLTNFSKIDVERLTMLRRSLRDNGARYIVVKNALAKIALERVGKGQLKDHVKGPCGIAVTEADATAPARSIRDFRKVHKDLLDLKVAFVEGSLFGPVDAERLADMPSREVLLSQFLSCLKAPMTNLAGSLNGILTKFVGTLEAVKNQKEAAGQL